MTQSASGYDKLSSYIYICSSTKFWLVDRIICFISEECNPCIDILCFYTAMYFDKKHRMHMPQATVGLCYFILAQSIIERVASGMMAIISFFKKKNEWQLTSHIFGKKDLIKLGRNQSLKRRLKIFNPRLSENVIRECSSSFAPVPPTGSLQAGLTPDWRRSVVSVAISDDASPPRIHSRRGYRYPKYPETNKVSRIERDYPSKPEKKWML